MSAYKCSFRIYIIFYHRRPFNKTAATLVRPHPFSTLWTTPLEKMWVWYSLRLHYFMIPDMISRQAENHLPYSSIRIHRDWASHCTHCSSPVHNQPKVSENSKDYYSNGGWGIGGQVLVLVLSFNSVPLGYALTSPFRRYNELWWNGELWRAM